MKYKKSNEIEEFSFEFGVIENPPNQNNISAKDALNQYMEVLYYQKKQKNALLGDFDANGKYAVSDPVIVRNLLDIPKKFEEKNDNIVYASAIKNNFVLNFKIEFKIEVDFCQANLYLIEIEHSVEEDIKHLTKLDNILTVYSPNFKDEVFKQWKIFVDDEIYEKNDFLFEYLRAQEEAFLFNGELTEILAQLYVVRILKILESSGEAGLKTIDDYKNYLEKVNKNDPGFKLNYANLKEVLDHFMFKHKIFDEVTKNSEMPAVLNSFALPIKKFKDKDTAPVKQEIQIPEKKEEKKPAKNSQAKKKGKAKSKSSGVKPAKIDVKYGGGSYLSVPSSKPKSKDKTKEVKVKTSVENPKTKKAEVQIDVKKAQTKPLNKEVSNKSSEVLSNLAESFLSRHDTVQKYVEINQQKSAQINPVSKIDKIVDESGKIKSKNVQKIKVEEFTLNL